LKDFGARYYNPEMARWTSPDPIIPNVFEPQSLNKYSYVGNDPANYVDPYGMNQAGPHTIYVTGETTLTYEQHRSWYLDEGGHGDYAWAEIYTYEVRDGSEDNSRSGKLGDAKKEANERIKDTECWAYLQKLISALTEDSLLTPNSLIAHVNDATYDLAGDTHGNWHTGSMAFGPNGKTWAEATSSSNITGIGPLNNVQLGYQFFYGTGQRRSTVLIHEAFHLFSGWEYGLWKSGIVDADLWKAASTVYNQEHGVDNYSVSGTPEFNRLIDEHCN
jgi:hypothetical protein